MDTSWHDLKYDCAMDGSMTVDTIVPYNFQGDSKAALPPCQVCGAPASG